jgi:16S rRNA (guanine527-N7)-methyltransferase
MFTLESPADPQFRQLLQAEFHPYGQLSPNQLDLLDHHYQLLFRWNPRLNLTRISDLEEVVRFHYCESLFVGTVLPPGPLSVGDLGSGAGFPGIPLGIFRPDLQMVLIESDSRKAVFLREATRDVKNIQVYANRLQQYRAPLDWVVSRAVAPSEVLESRLAPNTAILMSAQAAPAGCEVIRLPWGRDRALVVSRGTVSRDTVSRGTSQ